MMSLKTSSDLDSIWNLAVDKDDAYCKGRASWDETRDAWRTAKEAAEKAGDAFSEMVKVAKSIFTFYETHREKTPTVGIHSGFRKPWRTRR